MSVTWTVQGEQQRMSDMWKVSQTIWRKIVPMKPNAQTVKCVVFCFLRHTKERGKLIEIKYKRNITFYKIVVLYVGEYLHHCCKVIKPNLQQQST